MLLLTLVLTLILAPAIIGTATTRADEDPIVGFVRGDCNADGAWDVGDPIGFLIWLLADGSPPGCSDACDDNDDGLLDISDGIHALGALFIGTAPPPAPYPACGLDPTPDALACESPPCELAPVVAAHRVVLPTTRVGADYTARLPAEAVTEVRLLADDSVIVPAVPFITYGLEATSVLPPGLSLDPATGTIAGVPTTVGLHRFDAWGLDAQGDTIRLRAELAVFSFDDGEAVAGQTFGTPGPFATIVGGASFLFTHELPWPTPYPLHACAPLPPPLPSVVQAKQLRAHLPFAPTEPVPLLLFHPGTGFQAADYDALLGRIASHGFACIAVEDSFSYETYTSTYCWGGHDEGARVMVAARNAIRDLVAVPSHPWHGIVDPERVVYAGHSRGAASALIAAEFDRGTSGVIALQPTDARGDSFIAPTDRWQELPGTPLLLITAEQDTDVSYPWAERLLERTTGPATAITIYGGCHGFTTDDHSDGCAPCTWTETPPQVDLCPYISRADQIAFSAHFSVAFLRRRCLGDLSLEGQLYGHEWLASPHLSLTARRGLHGATWVDDFRDFPFRPDGNLWISSGSGAVGTGPCYDAPFPGSFPVPPIENLIVEVDADGSPLVLETWLGTTGNGVDLTGHRALVLRLKNHDRWQLVDNFGLGWLDLRVELGDLDGTEVTLPLDECLPSAGVVPGSVPSGVPLKAQRFVDVRVPLTDFILVNPGLDLSAIATFQLRFAVDAGATLNTTAILGLDDIRFE